MPRTKYPAIITFAQPKEGLRCSVTHLSQTAMLCKGEVALVEFGCTHTVPLCVNHIIGAEAMTMPHCLFCGD